MCKFLVIGDYFQPVRLTVIYNLSECVILETPAKLTMSRTETVILSEEATRHSNLEVPVTPILFHTYQTAATEITGLSYEVRQFSLTSL